MSHSHTQSQGNPTRDEPGPFTFMVNMLQLHNRTTITPSGEWDMRGSSDKSARSSLKIILKTLPFKGLKKPVSHESAAVLEGLLGAGQGGEGSNLG